MKLKLEQAKLNLEQMDQKLAQVELKQRPYMKVPLHVIQCIFSKLSYLLIYSCSTEISFLFPLNYIF